LRKDLEEAEDGRENPFGTNNSAGILYIQIQLLFLNSKVASATGGVPQWLSILE
jgi:hypothetical protein